jgi:formamidopyrimidine-DNA glycosylase
MIGVEVCHERTARHNSSVAELVAILTGRRIDSVDRHGKFLVIGLDDSHTMVGHLGMSGRFTVTETGAPRESHTHFVARLDDGNEIRFIDPRTFGFVAVYDEDEMGRSGVTRLGRDAYVDPPTSDELAAYLEGRTAPIKALLLDQGSISGLGNIYADESLFGSGLHPLTPGGVIDGEALTALLESIYNVLESAIDNGGTTLDDLAYLLPDGRAGRNRSQLAVYGREGEPCIKCGTPIERVIVRGRSTHYCPECQSR